MARSSVRRRFIGGAAGMLALGKATGAKFNLIPYGGGNLDAIIVPPERGRIDF